MNAAVDKVTVLDAMVIGAGVAGLYQLYNLRKMGLKVRAYDTATGVGGTWYWNRYPGARFDSQAEIYQYWFDEEMYKSWKPSERFPAQPETEEWLNYVADRHDLKKDIQFSTRISSAHYDETSQRWNVTTDSGERINTQFLIACCGMLSAPIENRFEGQSSFKGEIYLTGKWPKDATSLKGKKVAVIGTGATGIQVIQTIAPEVGNLTVFCRTPQYVIPMKNPKYSEEDWAYWCEKYNETKNKVLNTFAGFDYDFNEKSWAESTPEEREKVLETQWEGGSLSLWLASYPEIFFDEKIGEEVSEFVRKKMRARLGNDPELCNLLIPTADDYTFGTHRVPLETNYLEVYLRDNVRTVDCRDTPIQKFVPEGIQTSDGTIHDFDVIILATGFDAGSGALSRIDFRGRDNRSLKDQWQNEITTAMGLQVHGYPNLFTTGAPLAPSAALCNMTTCLQYQVNWITDCIDFALKNGKATVEVSQETQDAWVKHHDEVAAKTLVVKTDSWYMGSNVEGKPRRLLSYIGGVNTYHQKCDEIAENGYPGFDMT
jgi:acetone monooxygenase